MNSLLSIESLSRGLAGGFEGVQWGLALRTPSKGPRKALGRPSEPPMKYEQMMKKKQVEMIAGEKEQSFTNYPAETSFYMEFHYLLAYSM